MLAPTHAELDLGDGAAVRRYAAGLEEPIDILVNNAGINPLGSADEVTDAEFDETLHVILRRRCCSRAHWRRRWRRAATAASST